MRIGERGVFHVCVKEEALTIIKQTVRQTGVATVATQHTPVHRQLPASDLGLEPGATNRVIKSQEYSQQVNTLYTMAGSKIWRNFEKCSTYVTQGEYLSDRDKATTQMCACIPRVY